jgi:hypothetical protein
MALRSLENCDDEMLGVAEPDEDVEVADDDALALELVLELEDELPHPATTAAATNPSTHKRNPPKLITARSSHRRCSVDTRHWATVSYCRWTPAGK